MKKGFIIINLIVVIFALTACLNFPLGKSENSTEDISLNNTKASGMENFSVIQGEKSNISESQESTESILPEIYAINAMTNQGNPERIAKAMRKAIAGEKIVIGTIGGSITQGAGASDVYHCYASLVLRWWKSKFDDSSIQLINAGIGATGSVIGVHRLQDDLLTYAPDFVIVEFAVNDSNNAQCKETYENLLRRVLQSKNLPGVIALMSCYQSALTAEEIHSEIARYYDLPIISYKEAVNPMISDNLLEWKDLMADSVHPNNTGHEILCELVTQYLDGIYDNLESIPETISDIPNSPVTSNQYVNTVIYTSDSITPISSGKFRPAHYIHPTFNGGWICNEESEPIVFKINAKTITIAYLKTIDGKGCKARVVINGNDACELNGNFSGGWGNYVEQKLVYYSDKSSIQSIEITLLPDGSRNEFTLLGIMVSN